MRWILSPSHPVTFDSKHLKSGIPYLDYIFFFDDPESEISELLRTRDHFSLKAHLGTNPKLFYLT